MQAARDACELVVDSVFEELRMKRIDSILRPYSTLYSIDYITLDLLYSAACADKRYDDCSYAEDEAIYDP